MARAIKAAKAVGLSIARVEIDAEGKIVVVLNGTKAPESVDELEAWRAKRDAVHLKGVHTVAKRIGDWKVGHIPLCMARGPRLAGEPGSAEFVDSYRDAHRTSRKSLKPGEVLTALTDAYQDSQEFQKLAERTRVDYRKFIRAIDAEFGTFPVKLLADRRCRADFLAWRDTWATRSRRQADYAWTVLARVLSWAVERGLVESSPLTKAGRLYNGNRAEKVWTPNQEKAFLEKASPPLALAMLMALWTGQRQGDLLALTWFNYDGASFRLKQSKTGVHVMIPVGAPLRVALDKLRGSVSAAGKILRNNAGQEWTPDGFRASWAKACRRAQIKGVTFHDLRGTAVLHLALAGATEAEIATLTGHRMHDVRSIFGHSLPEPQQRIGRIGGREAARAARQQSGNISVNQAVNRFTASLLAGREAQ